MSMLIRATLATGVLCAASLYAQDTRKVVEPTLPTACAQLKAQLQDTPASGIGRNLAEEDEAKLDTARIQAAIDQCKPGQAVELTKDKRNNSFLSGPLELREGVTLLIDAAVTLYGSRDAKLYDLLPLNGEPAALLCGTLAETPPETFPAPPAAPKARGGCRPLIAITNARNAGIMGDGTIDGRGYAKILGKDYSWWELARRAEPKNQRYYNPRLIVANHADGLILYRITLHNSYNFHVSVNGTDGFTAWAVHLLTPTDRSMDARNTDGIDPGTSTNITVTKSWIDNGDDNIAIKSGTTHMSVLDNHFYSGHGMSIGSETTPGQAYLLVDGLTEDHTTSGIRIKSNVTRGGPVHDLTYQNICMREVKNPIAISPFYTNQTTEGFVDPKYTGDKIPDYKAITIRNVIANTAGDVLIAGLNEAHRTEITLDNVQVEGIKPEQVHSQFTTATIGPGPVNFTLTGTGVTLNPIKGSAGTAFSCEGKFLPMR
jgi:polygalacturonase